MLHQLILSKHLVLGTSRNCIVFPLTGLIQNSMAAMSTVAERSQTGLVWFKPTDLRLDDHEPLFKAHQECQRVVHCFVYDTHPTRGVLGAKSKYGSLKVGPRRLKWLNECVIDLRDRLIARGSNLVVRVGDPATEIANLCATIDKNSDGCSAMKIFAHEETCLEELQMVDSVKSAATCPVDLLWGGQSIVHVDDFPYDSVCQVPNVYTQFRQRVENKNGRGNAVKRYVAEPTVYRPQPECIARAFEQQGTDFSSMPAIDHDATSDDPRSAIFGFIGGETAALQRLDHYFKGNDTLAQTYKETRNEMLGSDYSTKFSLWLATGCVSARRILKELDQYEANVAVNKSTYWIWFELLWRDFFRFQAVKQGKHMFWIGGPQHATKVNWSRNTALLTAWKDGRTGYPLVDANMVELKHTGFMSNRGRQIVASFLTKDMSIDGVSKDVTDVFACQCDYTVADLLPASLLSKVGDPQRKENKEIAEIADTATTGVALHLTQDWRLGAAYFEEALIDYDCASNWGNWTYSAGVGCDPREDRYFSILKQGKVYDANAAYIKTWLPALKDVPTAMCLDAAQLNGHLDNATYPNPPVVKLKFAGGGYASDTKTRGGRLQHDVNSQHAVRRSGTKGQDHAVPSARDRHRGAKSGRRGTRLQNGY